MRVAADDLPQLGYVLESGASLEELDMGGGSVLALLVTGSESDGRVTVIEGVVHLGGPYCIVDVAFWSGTRRRSR